MNIRIKSPKSVPNWFIVFTWFILTLSLFYSGHLYSNDTVTKLESAKNFIEYGSFDINMSSYAWGQTGRNGKIFPHFSIGSIIIMIPPVLVFKVLSILKQNPPPLYILSVLTTGMNMIYTALIGVLIFIFLLYFNRSKKSAFLFSNILIFCTILFPYSSSGWSEPASFLCGLFGFIILFTNRIISSKPLSRNRWLIWGFCAGMTSLIRIEYTLFFLTFTITWIFIKKNISKKNILSLLIFFVVISTHFFFNNYRYESFFNFGYTDSGLGNDNFGKTLIDKLLNLFSIVFSMNTLKNFFWFFLSFGKNHWFWVSPLLALSPIVFYYRNNIPFQIMTVFISSIIILPLYIFLINTVSWCCMTWSWGYRYFYISFPYLLIPIAFFPIKQKPIKFYFTGLCIAGFIIGVFASAVNFHVVLEKLIYKYGYEETMWGKTSLFWNAPFWTHVKLFPKQFINTLGLIVKGGNLPTWEVLRTDYLDIWPVGMCGAGINSFISFGLWFVLVGITLLFGFNSVRPHFLRYEKL